MTASLAERFETYRGNMTPGMFSLLSEQLSVSRDSLETLGIGFYPAKDAWVFPERDAAGEIVGLVLRSDNGFKFMVVGSARGLTYVLNSDYEIGDRRYDPGKHNWIRAYETPYLCPMCHQNDWCLLSRTDPGNPPAVICGRISEGAHKSFGESGYLHILRSSNKAVGGLGGAFATTDDPVVVVEGQTDTLTAMDMGLPSVGRPNNVAGQGLLKELLAGRTVIVVGENDAPDKYGKIPGVVGMETTFETLFNAGCNVTRVLPPEGSKDLRAWVQRFTLTKEQFLEYVVEHGDQRRNVDILPDDTGLTIAKHWIDAQRMVDGLPTVRSYKSQWVEFDESRYKLLPLGTLKSYIYNYLDGRYFFKEIKGVDEPVRYRPSKNKISDVIDALYSWGPIDDDPPLWLVKDANLPDPVNLIQFKNGILDVNEYIRGNIKLLSPTPRLFSFTSLPHTFRPEAYSTYWLDYLNTIFDGDQDRIRLLQQWFGYNLVPDVSFEKMMFLIGRPCSGKGTIVGALNAMLGDEQVCSTTLDYIAGHFGYQVLIGKLAVLCGDMKTPRANVQGAALEKVLQITGGDPVGIARKHIDDIPQFHLQCRFTVAMNLLPTLPDHAAALERRLCLIQFPNSYVGVADRAIKQKIKSIAGDIIPWALEGLKDLRTSNAFCYPESSERIIARFKNMSSPVFNFCDDYCDLYPDDNEVFVEAGMLYDAWKMWTCGQNMQPGIRPQFMQRLLGIHPYLTLTESTLDDDQTHRTGIIRGICLKQWVEKELGD